MSGCATYQELAGFSLGGFNGGVGPCVVQRAVLQRSQWPMRSQGLCELAEFMVSGLKRIPFPENDAAPRTKHQKSQFAPVLRSKREIRRRFACRTNENQRPVSSLHS